MLISYPLLSADSAKPLTCAEAPESGTYISNGLGRWHGGVHLAVPNSATTGQIRAIADGEVVAYRVPKSRPKNAEDEKKDDLYYHRGWTSDGFVLLKHIKECGRGRVFKFYSLYMHLGEISHPELNEVGGVQINPRGKAKKPILLRRKQPFARAGCIDGQDHLIHFEVFTTEESLGAFFKRGDGGAPKLDDQNNGSPDPWGELFFVVPQGVDAYRQENSEGQPGVQAEASQEKLILGLRYVDGHIHVRVLGEEGQVLATWARPRAEYRFYGEQAAVKHPDYISRAYEIQRFGRILPWDGFEDKLPPEGAHCWLWLWTKKRWVDLAHPKVHRLSDADFPAWFWRKAESGEVVEPCTINVQPGALLEKNAAPKVGDVNPGDWAAWLMDTQCREHLRGLIVQHESEWDSRDFESRWGAVRQGWLDPRREKLRQLDVQKSMLLAQAAAAQSALPGLQKQIPEAEAFRPSLEKMVEEQNPAVQSRKAALAARRQELAELIKEGRSAEDKKRKKKQKEVGRAEVRLAESEDSLSQCQGCLDAADKALKDSKQRLAKVEDFLTEISARLKSLDKQREEAEKEPEPADSVKQEAETAFRNYKAHLEALQWYQKVPDLPEKPVFFHPLAFVEHFGKCHWLSLGEMWVVFRGAGEHRKVYRQPLNRILTKYGIGVSKARMIHFIGQISEETGDLTLMQEKCNSGNSLKLEVDDYYKDPDSYGFLYRYERSGNDLGNVDKAVLKNSAGKILEIVLAKNGDRWVTVSPDPAKWRQDVDFSKSTIGDGQTFRGRGLIQLTGRALYAQYWVYRGWLNRNSFLDKWWVHANKNPAIIDKPHRIGAAHPENCFDSAGWYWEKRMVNTAICGNDISHDAVKAVTRMVNGGLININVRQMKTDHCGLAIGDTIDLPQEAPDVQKAYSVCSEEDKNVK